MTNCINSNNADLKTIADNVNLSQRDSDVKFKYLHNDKMNVISIINLLTQTLTLEKEKNKDYSWKKVTLKLIQRLWNISERKIKKKKNQDVFITKNVQKLKTFIQLLNK